MPIRVNVPSALQSFSRGARSVQLAHGGVTVRDALRELAVAHPGVVDRVLTESVELREHVNVFVGEENCRFIGGLAAQVQDGDTLEVVASVSGG